MPDLKQFIIAHAAKQHAHKKNARPDSIEELEPDLFEEQPEMAPITEEAAPQESPVASIVRRLRRGAR